MSIQIACQSCSKRYRVKDELAGATLRCKECGSVITVPRGSAQGKGRKSPPSQPASPAARPKRTRTGSRRRPRRSSNAVQWIAGGARDTRADRRCGLLSEQSTAAIEAAGPTSSEETFTVRDGHS